MISKNLVIDHGDIHIQYKPRKVLTLISITLSTLIVLFSYRLIFNLMFPNISPLNNEINTILSICLAVNIAAYLILYEYVSVLKELENRHELKKSELKGAHKNFKIEVKERKRLELDLQRSEKKCSLLLTLIPAMAFKGYIDFSMGYSDDKFLQLTGYKKHDFKSGKIKWSDLIIKDDLNQVRKQSLEALKNGKQYVREYRIRNREGKLIWVQERAKIFWDKEGKVEYVNALIFDSAEPKQTEDDRSRLSVEAPSSVLIWREKAKKPKKIYLG